MGTQPTTLLEHVLAHRNASRRWGRLSITSHSEWGSVDRVVARVKIYPSGTTKTDRALEPLAGGRGGILMVVAVVIVSAALVLLVPNLPGLLVLAPALAIAVRIVAYVRTKNITAVTWTEKFSPYTRAFPSGKGFVELLDNLDELDSARSSDADYLAGWAEIFDTLVEPYRAGERHDEREEIYRVDAAAGWSGVLGRERRPS